MLRFFLPKNGSFFEYFENHISLTIEACNELLILSSKGKDSLECSKKIKEIEHKTDSIAHSCIDALHKTFITPFDRADIHRLIKRLDDIIDSIDAATLRITLYEIKEIRSEVKEIAEILIRATSEIEKALKNMRNMKNAKLIEENCRAIYQAENDGDQTLRRALLRLFKDEKDPIMVIKWKEIFETLEKASDRCEDVANIIQGIVIEAT